MPPEKFVNDEKFKRGFSFIIFNYGPVVHLAEHSLRMREVGGSSPPRSTSASLKFNKGRRT